MNAEAELIERCVRGDKSAFELIYRDHVGFIYSLCMRMCGDRILAEDLTQDAFILAWQKIHLFKGRSSFKTWMYRLTSNLVIGQARKKSLWTEELNDRHAQHCIQHDEDAEPLEIALMQLPSKYRSLLILHDYLGYTHKEIAALAKTPVGTCKSILHRGRTRIRQFLEERNDD